MHSAVLFSAVLAFVSTAVSAAPATAAAACNPSYDVATSTPCFTACNVKAGEKFVSGWTMDSSSPLFIKSLAVMCEKSSPDFSAFMTAAGTCMTGCTGDDPELFNKEFAGACAWYTDHKTDTC
ncbi:hypothetical protein HPULCUR_002306 [Helicostylum pulchrum]|uniref:Uncharacterized protein n=1 Tax=Helicostylum pulchrum TaxID=562976 RepID=A0ABP9XRW6_9FUNG